MSDETPELPEKTELTHKQAAFVREYPVDWNATQAAIRAGYSEESARQIGSENLSKPAVAEAIQQHLKAIESAAIMGLQEALARVTSIARASLAEQLGEDVSIPDAKRLREAGQALKKVEWTEAGVKIEMIDPLKALEMLAKLRGWAGAGDATGVTINNIIGVGDIRAYRKGRDGGQ